MSNLHKKVYFRRYLNRGKTVKMDYETFFNYLDKNEQKEAMEYKNKFIPNKLYNFRALNDDSELNTKKFNSLRKGQIWLSRLDDFNDPFEYANFYIDPEVLKNHAISLEELNRALVTMKKNLGAACFTDDINNLPMWAHYANNHQGFCVEYELGENNKTSFKDNLQYPFSSDKDAIFPVSYETKRVEAHKVAFYYLNSILQESGNQVFEDLRWTPLSRHKF